MNRVIKFRAWDTGKMWIEGAEDNGTYPTDCLLVLRNNGTPLMQFTGLLDKNGKEIYEGDIVRIENYEANWKHGEPKFDWRVFKVIHNKYIYAFENSVIYTPFSSYDGSSLDEWRIEIIGNIYENPELLTKEI